MSAPEVDKRDLQLLQALQETIPLVHNPWDILGERIGCSGDEVLTRLKRLSEVGILKGITPILEAGKRRGVSTLIALQVPEEAIDRTVAVINRYPEVSHNFRRDGEYNIWFTLATPEYRMDQIISEILIHSGIHQDQMLNLKTIRRYKIDVQFPFLTLTGDSDGSR